MVERSDTSLRLLLMFFQSRRYQQLIWYRQPNRWYGYCVARLQHNLTMPYVAFLCSFLYDCCFFPLFFFFLYELSLEGVFFGPHPKKRTLSVWRQGPLLGHQIFASQGRLAPLFPILPLGGEMYSNKICCQNSTGIIKVS